MTENKKIYRLNDDICFRKCSLYDGERTSHGDCTDFSDSQHNWQTYYTCNSNGIHFHCTTHPEIELDYHDDYCGDRYLECPRCKKKISIVSISDLTSQCMKLLNREVFKDAELIRLDDWYVPEIKVKLKNESDYWITADVKTDRDGDTIVVLYVGNKNSKEKAQYFIKPEKLQLSSDHKDMDPAKVLSRIEVTLRDRKLTQSYD